MVDHVQIVHPDEVFRCIVCDKYLISREEEINHTQYAHHKVSVLWRMFFCWSPWAYLHIGKFVQSWVLLAVLSLVFVFGIITVSGAYEANLSWASIIFLPIIGIPILLMLFMMKKWAIEWNKKIDIILESNSENDSSL